ncbi:multinuclear nonheme iron-dependent oxidase [Photorhabdus laumondii]
MRIACGFNPNFLSGEIHIPSKVSMIELGITAYNILSVAEKRTPFERYNGKFSLHIARSAITEDIQSGCNYINNIMPRIINTEKTISIGFHLCGNRKDNIGKYGFTPHYERSKRKERNAINFLKRVSHTYQIDTWIENSNFYSGGPSEISNAIISANYISKESNSKQIVDLAHLIINSVNAKVDPLIFIGMIDWDNVVEVHLSGIIEGKDGAFHDGHSERIHHIVWDSFEKIVSSKLIKKNCYINIEHTENSWLKNLSGYNNDFEKLNSILLKNKETSKPSNTNMSNYAKSYLSKTLLAAIKNKKEIEIAKSENIESLISSWILSIEESEVNLCLTKEEEDETINSVHYLKSFESFVNR